MGEFPVSLALRRERFRRALRRLSNAFLWILGAAWLGMTWGLDFVDPAPGSLERLFVRPGLGAAATVVGAWILWTALSAVTDEKMPRPVAPDDEDEAAAGSASRLGTLLPLVRNIVLMGLAAIAVIVALSTLCISVIRLRPAPKTMLRSSPNLSHRLRPASSRGPRGWRRI